MSSLWGFATTSEPEVGVEAAMEEAAQGLRSLAGVRAIVVVSERGTTFYEWYRTSTDKEQIRLSGPDLLSLAKQARSFLAKAGAIELEDILLRAGNLLALLHVASRGFLLVLADRSANLAMLLLRTRATAEQVALMLR